MIRILAIDDEEQILMLIQNALKKEAYEVTVSTSVTEQLLKTIGTYDLILLDVMMPYVNGFELCSKIRDLVDCPILFLTAKTFEEDVDYGLSLGADDYIKKPFSIVELRARIQAHLRRENRPKHQCLFTDDIRFYLKERKVMVAEQTISLTKSEYSICELLVRNKGQVYSREQIYEHVFGFDKESDLPAITEHIKNIRRKFLTVGKEPITTVWGIGYKWD